MMVQPVWLKPGIWGAVIGGVLTMIVGFGWGGWTTSGTAGQMAVKQADAAVTAALVPICLAGQKIDVARVKKLGELTAITSSWEQTEFVMKTGWATFPGQADPNRARSEEHTSELQSRQYFVCRLLLEKKITHVRRSISLQAVDRQRRQTLAA